MVLKAISTERRQALFQASWVSASQQRASRWSMTEQSKSRRGSLSIDDEGTPTNRTVLIDNGVLVGYMQDRLNARLMGAAPTGNGRRQSFAHSPMPRMTNTVMLSGDREPQEIIASVDRGLYAVNFGGGQVDITSGKFVFSCTEAYKIENGKIGAPVKGAMIIGSGADALTRISMVGNDMKLEFRHRNLRQTRPGRACGRGTADASTGQDHGRRNGGVGQPLLTDEHRQRTAGSAPD